MKGLLNAADVAEICQVKISKAYNIIREVNQEMEAEGYLVIKGRVNREYLFGRLGISKEVAN
ncbi:hypothetical protein PM10SUCC1_32870 [Propionigenium maris DSM 9537]|uniref:DNA-binding protein n=1 Tax=Propionigenium maris DSM 9537 TaxID=1123000 RepID=A0A9W6GMF4_9FUSO|nr:transcriptional regulator [Propionigenium maris]GLI57773.1 hypothetical protein PM10SUCC1_32870 [Propionigenium maris DSM 9537]